MENKKISSEDILANMNTSEKQESSDFGDSFARAYEKHKENTVEAAAENEISSDDKLESFFREEAERRALSRTGPFEIKNEPNVVKVPLTENEYERQAALVQENRVQKAKSFVLSSEEGQKAKKSKTAYGQKEFEGFEEAAKVQNDILHVKNNLFLRICVLMFTGITSILITAANDMELPVIRVFDRSVSPAAYLFSNTIMGLLALGVSFTVMSEGVKNMIIRKPDCDSVAALSIFVSVASCIAMIFEPDSIREGRYHVYISAAIMGLIFNTLGKLMIVMRTEKNFRYIAGDFERYAVKNITDKQAAEFGEGVAPRNVKMAALQKTEFVEDFVKHAYAPDITDMFAQKTAPLILIAGAVIGVMSFVLQKGSVSGIERLYMALAAFSGTLCMCQAVGMMLAVNMPINKASAKYLQNSGAILGYSAVDEYGDTNSVLLDIRQLFPRDSVDIAGVKQLSQISLEECIKLAAGITACSDSLLKNCFYKMLKGNDSMLYRTDKYEYEDGLGLTAWFENKRVLLGTREHMEKHMIEGLPPLSLEKEFESKDTCIIYLSVSGVAATLFAVKTAAVPSTARSLRQLEKDGVTMVIRSVDGFFTEDYLAKLFNLRVVNLRLLPASSGEDYAIQSGRADRVSSAMLCSGSLKSFVMLISGVKKIKLAAQLGIMIQMGSILLGAAICFLSMAAGSFAQITPTLVIVYNLIFALITAIFMKSKAV